MTWIADDRIFIRHHLDKQFIPFALRSSIRNRYFGSRKNRTDIKGLINKAQFLTRPLLNACYKPTLTDEFLESLSIRHSKAIEERSEFASDGCASVVNYLKVRGLADLFPMAAAEREARNNDGYIYDDGGTIKRLISDRWLLRRMRKKAVREIETIAHNHGLVRGDRQRYVSDSVLRYVDKRRRINAELLKKITAVNEDGDEFTLSELSALSVSNPKIKNAELMVRMRGNDDYALKHNHVADMWTITAPSKYHSSSDKWGGSTPRDAQKYLSRVWARFRAAAKRRNVAMYGFRVAEPHKDGCPHWHVLIFFENKKIMDACRDLMYMYALREDGKESGARVRRFNVKAVDRSKGSAVGYIAKYISKNIDGADICDIDGREPVHGARRVSAWASVWGIRQFQSFGNPSVTAWRELRRLEGEESGQLEVCRLAADSSNWCDYIEAQGGHSANYAGHPVKVAYWNKVGEAKEKKNEFGELVEAGVFGLVCAGKYVLTRIHEWIITDRPESFRLSNESDGLAWTCVNNCTVEKIDDFGNLVSEFEKSLDLSP